MVLFWTPFIYVYMYIIYIYICIYVFMGCGSESGANVWEKTDLTKILGSGSATLKEYFDMKCPHRVHNKDLEWHLFGTQRKKLLPLFPSVYTIQYALEALFFALFSLLSQKIYLKIRYLDFGHHVSKDTSPAEIQNFISLLNGGATTSTAPFHRF